MDGWTQVPILTQCSCLWRNRSLTFKDGVHHEAHEWKGTKASICAVLPGPGWCSCPHISLRVLQWVSCCTGVSLCTQTGLGNHKEDPTLWRRTTCSSGTLHRTQNTTRTWVQIWEPELALSNTTYLPQNLLCPADLSATGHANVNGNATLLMKDRITVWSHAFTRHFLSMNSIYLPNVFWSLCTSLDHWRTCWSHSLTESSCTIKS